MNVSLSTRERGDHSKGGRRIHFASALAESKAGERVFCEAHIYPVGPLDRKLARKNRKTREGKVRLDFRAADSSVFLKPSKTKAALNLKVRESPSVKLVATYLDDGLEVLRQSSVEDAEGVDR